jgi:hypothetical protein
MAGVPIPVSYHGTEAGCEATLKYVRTMAPDKTVKCIPGDYAPPPPTTKKSNTL